MFFGSAVKSGDMSFGSAVKSGDTLFGSAVKSGDCVIRRLRSTGRTIGGNENRLPA